MKTIQKVIIALQEGKDTYEAAVFYTDETWVENYGFQTEEEARAWSETIIKENAEQYG